ncbi:uncharacterized protein [Typha latifolia]|uniref:uncharacterized protein n=1 Tax=Typha latifolia TaxID=4733 RepID=UPI003C2B8D7B
MELESEFGDRILIESGSTKEIGRGVGLEFGRSSSDRTVSRRHLSLRLLGEESKLHFEVVGRNPIVICRGEEGGRRVYRSSEKGELSVGDRFSLSLKYPSFFAVRRVGEEKGEVEKAVLDAVERREKRTLERRREKEETARMEIAGGVGDQEELELDIESLDISQTDPVKEFGFLVRGHEFDKYPRQKILPLKDWNWFLEVVGRNSDDEEGEVNERVGSSKGKGRRRRNKKGEEGEDEEWIGEGEEEEKDFVAKSGSAKRPRYTTRSKDHKRPRNEGEGVQRKVGTQHKAVKDHINDKDEEDEEDETLGGFLVNNDEEEEAEEEESEEEEEFVEEDDDE